jgi:hypothetical protein
MSDSFDFVKTTVNASQLSEEDKQLILSRLSGANGAIAELLEKVLKEDPALLNKFVESLKVKIAAQGDERALEDIARAEEKEITKALNA